MRKPLISTVIITFNRANLLKNCLESLKKQITSFPYEVIVIDNGSTDNTKKIVEDFGYEYVFVPQQESKRPRHLALNYSRGKFIAFIDDDALAQNDWIEQIGIFFKKNNKNVAAIGGKIKDISQNIIGEVDHLFNFGNHYGKKYLVVRTVPTVNACYRKDVLKKINFDKKIYLGEDVDLNWRIKKEGFVIFYNPKLIVSHLSINNLHDFINKRIKQGEGFFKIRRIHSDLPLKIPSSFIWFSLFFYVYVVGSWIRSTKTNYFITKLPRSILYLPYLFIAHRAFWLGVYKSFKKEKNGEE